MGVFVELCGGWFNICDWVVLEYTGGDTQRMITLLSSLFFCGIFFNVNVSYSEISVKKMFNWKWV